MVAAETAGRRGRGSYGGRLGVRHVLLVLAGLLMLADLYLMLMVAPTDSVLGQVQRIFYFHVPIAVMSFLAFFVVFLASVIFLARRTPVWDRLAHASAEVGVVFVTLALVTGVIWARPIWNTWWTWEPRLTTTLILWLIYVAYLMIRSYAPSRQKGHEMTTHNSELVNSWPGRRGHMANGKVHIGEHQPPASGNSTVTTPVDSPRNVTGPAVGSKPAETGDTETGR